MTAPGPSQGAPRFWVVTPRSDRAHRWLRLLESMGVSAASLDGLAALERSASAEKGGFALVDWDFLSHGPAPILRSLFSRTCGLTVAVFAQEESLFGPAVTQAMEAGAQDFFAASEADDRLAVRLRPHVEACCPRGTGPGVTESGGVRIDGAARGVWVRRPRKGWRPVEKLTRTEFDILELFLSAHGSILSRDFLMDRAWGARSGKVNLETVDKHVASLRKKLGPEGKRIVTVRGQGYRLENPY